MTKTETKKIGVGNGILYPTCAFIESGNKSEFVEHVCMIYGNINVYA